MIEHSISLPVDKGFDRHVVFEHLLNMFSPCSLVDLGAGTCGASEIARRYGFDVTAVDIEPGRVPINMRDVYIQADALMFDITEYDLIVCEGLLYHLSIDQQIRLVQQFIGKPVLFSTHITFQIEKTIGCYSGQYREPTWSSKVPLPWLHTLKSLITLFSDHWLLITASTPTFDRVAGMAISKRS